MPSFDSERGGESREGGGRGTTPRHAVYGGAEVLAREGPLESTAASLPVSLRKLVLHNNLL